MNGLSFGIPPLLQGASVYGYAAKQIVGYPSESPENNSSGDLNAITKDMGNIHPTISLFALVGILIAIRVLYEFA